MMLPNNRLKLTAHLAKFLSARSLAWALGLSTLGKRNDKYSRPERENLLQLM
jgi:hypothetical protein